VLLDWRGNEKEEEDGHGLAEVKRRFAEISKILPGDSMIANKIV
jgi:hypothetical protein